VQTVGEYIEEKLAEKGLNKLAAAKLMNISDSTLSRLCAGKSELSVSMAANLSKLDIDLNELLEVDKQNKLAQASVIKGKLQ